jgi:5-methylcytosine-specific restriction endonuclease McrA
MTECFECGAPAAHQHHVVPRSLGGTKTVPLCEGCHGKVHGRRHLVVKIEPVPSGRPVPAEAFEVVEEDETR